MPGRVRERPRLGRSRGSQEDPENRGHVIGRDKEASQEAGRQRRRERFPLCQGRKTEPWKMVKMTEVEKVEAGRYRGTPGRGKEALLKESPREKGRRAGEGSWSGRSQGPEKKGFLYVIVLEPPPMSVPSQPGLPALLRSHRCGRAGWQGTSRLKPQGGRRGANRSYAAKKKRQRLSEEERRTPGRGFRHLRCLASAVLMFPHLNHNKVK